MMHPYLSSATPIPYAPHAAASPLWQSNQADNTARKTKTLETKTFRVFSALLSYPSEELKHAAPEMVAILKAEQLLPSREYQALVELITYITTTDLYTLQEHYVEIFDRSRELSLHLFEHIHGENKSRGQAMVSLGQLYEEYGVFNTTNELPDYLPLFLEFLSLIPKENIERTLVEPLAIFKALTKRLEKRSSPYAAVLSALVILSQGYAQKYTQSL